jgi:hypothetical protein
MNAIDHYALVLTDLEAQRERIDIAIDAIRALRRPSSTGAELHISDINEGAPPPAPPVRRKRTIPTDPYELRTEANRLLDSGMGMMEVAADLELTPDQIQSIFYGSHA